jgi:hypothetical protein
MTAEVAVMNRQAVALAADSAVTIQYPGGQKIFNSVNKLFTLSKFAPVGVMVYGVATLTGVPWETIIKSFRRQLGDQRFPTLKEYADDLVAYINQHKLMFSDELQAQQFGSSVMLQFRHALQAADSELKALIADKGAVDEKDVRRVVNKAIRDFHKFWMTSAPLSGVPAKYDEMLRSRFGAGVDPLIDFVFGNLPVTAASRKRLHELAINVFSRDLFPDNVSGVVVAGFGEDEFFPSLLSYDMEGVLLNFLKVRENAAKSAAIAGGVDSSAIVPFAQGEMVSLFMEGIDPRFRREIYGALERLLIELGENVVNASSLKPAQQSQLARSLEREASGLIQQFHESVREHCDDRHIGPVVSAVSNLPKEELAGMAEALVSLTSFKRRVTQDPETVGGPVDVAVISKGDGFIWMNRKHYFDPTLNHHFFANYYRT